jgi:glycosyltransferase involved in cell wall biosynthesis|tara:strand:+ start:25362 stop:26114 length:753 start_codon:yes stop_codon:yes gene_type:complete
MDISIIVSSFNQRRRLRLCLDSLSKQFTNDGSNRGGFEYEVILADDHSTDGTLDWVAQEHPNVVVSLNDSPEENTYTLADNWNTAAKKATGKRLVFSNADMIYCRDFLRCHLDEVMQDSIIFGPGYSTAPPVDGVLDSFESAKDAMIWLENNNQIGTDRHSERSADTYNIEWKWWFPFGYNFSVIREQFEGVGGFPSFKKWGEEETQLCKRIVDKYGTTVKSNNNTYAVHLWHPRVNNEDMVDRVDDIRF